jgi:hypothetical protein
MALISASLIRRRCVLLGRLAARYPAFSASVSAIHAATVAGFAPASSAARYPASLRSHSAILSAVSSWPSGRAAGSAGWAAARSAIGGMSERDVFDVDEHLVFALLVPYLVAGVAGVDEDRADGELVPCDARSVLVPLEVVRGLILSTSNS